MKKSLIAISAALMCGCVSAPTGPSVLVLPGSTKTFEQFRADDTNCRSFALAGNDGRTAQQAANESTAKSAAVGTIVGATAGAVMTGGRDVGPAAGIGLLVGAVGGLGAAQDSSRISQRQFDNAYIQCMYTHGHRVPVVGGLTSQPGSPAAPIPKPPVGYVPPPPNAPPPPNLPPPDLPKASGK